MTRLCSTLGLQFGFGFATADPSLLLNNHASKFCLHNIILQYPLQFPGNFLALLFPFLFAKFCIFQTTEGVRLRVLSSHILPCATPSRYAMLTSLAIGLDTPSLLLEGLWSDELKMQHAILRESRPAFNIITGPIFQSPILLCLIVFYIHKVFLPLVVQRLAISQLVTRLPFWELSFTKLLLALAITWSTRCTQFSLKWAEYELLRSWPTHRYPVSAGCYYSIRCIPRRRSCPASLTFQYPS